MSDTRISGALLLVLSTLAFLASTRELLPAASVFPALLLFAIGAVQLLRGQRQAAQRARPAAPLAKGSADRATSSVRHDLVVAERRAMRSGASRQALSLEFEAGAGLERPAITTTGSRAGSTSEQTLGTAAPEIELEDAILAPGLESDERESEKEDEDADFLVSGDVSFPIEVQQGDALADQLRKLSQLLEQGVLSEAEYALAKAKLLS